MGILYGEIFKQGGKEIICPFRLCNFFRQIHQRHHRKASIMERSGPNLLTTGNSIIDMSLQNVFSFSYRAILPDLGVVSNENGEKY